MNRRVIIIIVLAVVLFAAGAIVYSFTKDDIQISTPQMNVTMNTAAAEAPETPDTVQVKITSEIEAEEAKVEIEAEEAKPEIEAEEAKPEIEAEDENVKNEETEAVEPEIKEDRPVNVQYEEVKQEMVDSTPEEEIYDDGRVKMLDLPFYNLDGTETGFFEHFEDRPVVMATFASWCPACRMLEPILFELQEEYEGRVDFIFLDSFDGRRETMKTLTDYMDKEFPDRAKETTFLDRGLFGYVFNTNALPSMAFIDGDGYFFTAAQGAYPKQAIKTVIDMMLQQVD